MNGIDFDGIHSFDTLGVILSSRTIGQASAKRYTVEIPGADGTLDMTNFFGETKYQNRTIKYKFSFHGNRLELEQKYSDICSKLNGIHFDKIVDDIDPNWYWTGYCSVSDLKITKNIGSVDVSVDAFPYKQKVLETITSFVVETSRTVTLTNSRRKVIPTIVSTGEMQLTFDGNTYTIAAGTYVISGIELSEGNNSILLTGNATVTFKYREGVL